MISADTLSNLNTKDPNVVTMGPSSIDPDTGKPYAMSFPVVSMRDSVRVHKALVDSLGVKKLQAAAGASGGSIQAMEWAALYPAVVDRVVHVIGPGFDIHPYVIQMLDEVKEIKAKILFVPASSDEIFPAELSQRAAVRYKAQRGTAEVAIIEGDGGHLDGLLNVAKQGGAIRAFLVK